MSLRNLKDASQDSSSDQAANAAELPIEGRESLLKAWKTNDTDVNLRQLLVKQLESDIMTEDWNEVYSLEGLFLKLQLEGGVELSEDVVSRLTLEEYHFSELSPEHLMRLSRQLGQQNRKADGARVATVAAKLLAASGQEKGSEHAYLTAFSMDHSNKDAAEGVVKVIRSTQSTQMAACSLNRGKGLEWSVGRPCCIFVLVLGLMFACMGLKMVLDTVMYHHTIPKIQVAQPESHKDADVDKRLRLLEEHIEKVEKTGLDAKSRIEKVEKASLDSEKRVELLEAPHLGLGSSMVWDLSKYDFTNFTKCQSQLSDAFQLPNGVNAWLNLEPKGHSQSSEGMAGLYFHVDKPAVLKWTWQSGSGRAVTSKRDFSKELDKDGKPVGWCCFNFMPISETNGSITLRVPSVQLPGSALRLI